MDLAKAEPTVEGLEPRPYVGQGRQLLAGDRSTCGKSESNLEIIRVARLELIEKR